MKLKSLFVPVIAMSFVLVACGPKPSPVKPNWSEDAQNLMKSYLHDEVLPYLDGAGEYTVEFDTDNNDIKIQSSIAITSEVLDGYIATYTAEGWVESVPLYQATYFSAEKALTLEGGTRWITVDFFLWNETEGEFDFDEGLLLMHTSDPFVYDSAVVTEHLLGIADNYYGSNVELSVLPAPRYLLGSYGVTLYGVEETIQDEFISAITSTWDVWDNTLVDDYGYRIAVSPDTKFAATFKYFTVGHYFDIYLDSAFFKDYDGVKAAASVLFTKYAEYGASEYTFPLINASFYKVADGVYNDVWIDMGFYDYIDADVYVYNTSLEAVELYRGTLVSDGWTVDSDEEDAEGQFSSHKIINGHTQYIDVYFEAADLMAYITFTLVGETE